MQYILENGYTSINLAKVITQCMINEKVPKEYVLVTKYWLVKHPVVAKNLKTKYIYLAYDAESIVASGRGWEEARILSSNTPELIITVSRGAYDFYKKLGFNTYYCPIGYDDINHKEMNTKRDYGLVCAWTRDEERESMFYHRYILANDVAYFMTNNLKKKIFVANNIPFNELNKLYSRGVLGLNDVVRQPNERCFEIPVNGGVMLINEEIRNTDYQLKENRHYYVYESTFHLVALIKKLLSDVDKTTKVGERAKKEALKYPQSMYVKKMVDKLGLR